MFAKHYLFKVIFIIAISLTVTFAHGMSCEDVLNEDVAVPYRALAQNLPVNAVLEITGISYPYGKAHGGLYAVAVDAEMAKKIREAEGERFRIQSTEFNSTTNALYTFLGFAVSRHPDFGEYWSSVPSPELLSYRIQEWNRRMANEPRRQIHLDFKTTGADRQLTMLKLWLNQNPTIGVDNAIKGDPFYIVNGSMAPTAQAMRALEMDVASGRAKENNNLWKHDNTQVVNALHLSLEPLRVSQRRAEFWLAAHRILAEKKANGQLPRVRGEKVDRIIEFYSRLPDRFGQILPPNTTEIDALRFLNVYIHHSQRRLHSIAHLLSWLILNPQGLDPQTFSITDRGLAAEQEISVHMAGLGFRAENARIPGNAPILHHNFSLASVGGILTLEAALSAITNVDRDQIREFVSEVNVPEITRLFDSMEQRGAFSTVSFEVLQEWAEEIRWRYREMR